MHALSHSLAHRAPPATRTRVRWQPYNPLQSATGTAPPRSPAPTFLHTPASSVTSSSPSHTPLCELDRLRQALPLSTLPSASPRDTSKNKYAVGLVDQAVKSLCEIWLPHDIPPVFLMSARPASTLASAANEPLVRTGSLYGNNRNTQLPSPISPSTQPSPAPANNDCRLSCEHTTDSRSNLVPLKGFVHEVLRRSRTSGGVLQTALCYLEAIRPKVPELVRREKAGEGVQGEPELASRIILEADLDADELPADAMSLDSNSANSDMPTAFLEQASFQATSITPSDTYASNPASATRPKTASPALPALPPLPSPLLCPRRAFLAALILASKFTQDRCYSNRAWAKLAGLPPREIGRCERALGDALGWRLWVGKAPARSCAQHEAPASDAGDLAGATYRRGAKQTRTVSRSHSDSALLAANARAATAQRWAAQQQQQVPPPVDRAAQMPVPGYASSSTITALPTWLGRSAAFAATALGAETPGVEWYNAQEGVQQWQMTPGEEHLGIDGRMRMSATMNTCSENTALSHVPFTPSGPMPYTGSSDYHARAFWPTDARTDGAYTDESPSTPMLSHSPSSTESSSGDRTVQMTVFAEDGTGAWPWLDVCEKAGGISVLSLYEEALGVGAGGAGGAGYAC